MERGSKILFGSILGLLVLGVAAAIIWPSLPSYNFASVADIKAAENLDEAAAVYELGDTNGPFRWKRLIVGGRNGTEFSFDLTFHGTTTNWSRATSSNIWFTASIFENRQGNEYALVKQGTRDDP